jgi:tRNA threonylcarbamoyladenosine biosynthesis protein TsaE
MKSSSPTSKNGSRGTKRSNFLFSPEETIAFGREFGKTLSQGDVVVFEGELAAGKTTLIKGIAEGAASFPATKVSSPTFVYLQIYEGTKTLYHFDLYRLNDPHEFSAMGFDEAFDGKGITLIEWPEKIPGMIPKHAIKVTLTHTAEGGRHISIDDPVSQS